MHFVLLLSALLTAVNTGYADKSPGCGQPLPKGIKKGEAGKSNDMTFGTSDSSTRRYLLHVPENYDVHTPTGLIWSFAGRGKTAERQENITKLSDPAFNENYIVVYPQAETNSTSDSQDESDSAKKLRRQSSGDEDEDEDEDDDWQWDEDDDQDDRSSGKNSKGQGQWQGDPTSHVNDVQFTLELLDSIEKAFCIDDEKVYASGLSNGGGFVANILACDATASKKFAAFAAASGAYYQNDVKGKCHADTVALTCNNNGTKVPIIVTHGGQDKVIKYEGGKRRNSCLPSVPHFITAWAERDGLGSTNTTSKVENTDVVHYSFGEGASAGMVQAYYVPDLGHKWPMDEKKTPISATKIFMDFFADWNMTARDAAAATTGDSKPSGTSSGGTSSGTSSSAASCGPLFSSWLVVSMVVAFLACSL